MTIARMMAAATLVVSTLGMSAAATAQDYHGNRDGYAQNDRGRHDDRRDDRYGDRGRHHGWDRRQQRCRVEWHHHRQVRVCR